MSGSSYRLGTALCHTPAELAGALTAHWDTGRHELMSGKITAWLEREGDDPGLVQFVRTLTKMSSTPEEIRLLRLILRLAPTHPPVWRGHGLLEADLRVQAARAERGERHAQQWLVSVFVQRALRVLPPALYPVEANLAACWETQYDNCMNLWHAITQARTNLRKEQTSIVGVTDFDALVYGEPAGLREPSPTKLLPILLLALTDATYGNRLRKHTRQAAMAWLAHNRWLERLLNGTDPVGWVIAGFLLPYARDATTHEQRRQHVAKATPAVPHADLTQWADEALAHLRAACTGLSPLATTAEREATANAGRTLLTLLVDARTRGMPAEDPLIRTLRAAEPKVRRIVKRLDTWTEAQQGNVLRRLWTLVELRNAIRELGHALPARVPTA